MSISTSETDPVESIYDLLDQATNDTSLWTNNPPEVNYYWDIPFAEKSPGADQPDRLYVWSPTGVDTPPFSADGERFDADATVEIQMWSLDEFDVKALQNDVLQFLSNYFADNKEDTAFTHIFPQTASDYREQNPSRRTEAYVMAVEIDLRRLSDTALAN